MSSILISHNIGLYSHLDVSEGYARSQKNGVVRFGIAVWPSKLPAVDWRFAMIL